MDSVHFLNLKYFIVLVYSVFTGATGSIDIAQVPTEIALLMARIALIGLFLTLLFFILLIYSYRRVHEVEHAGWHKRHEEEKRLSRRHIVSAPRNPQWEHVITLANSPVEGDWRRAILEADIMLGSLLSALGYRGSTIGDMLKDANPIQFTTLDMAWAAHKIRNEVAHGGESFTLTERETKGTIDLYRRVFEEFDYI
jgi:hypothetical protein